MIGREDKGKMEEKETTREAEKGHCYMENDTCTQRSRDTREDHSRKIKEKHWRNKGKGVKEASV